LRLSVTAFGKDLLAMLKAPPIIAIVVGLLGLGLLIAVVAVKRTRKEALATDYRALFIMGICWLPVGLVLGNPGLWGMGLVFLIIGLANRGKWKEARAWSDLSPVERRTRLVLLVGLALLLVVGLVFYLAGGSTS